MKIRRPYGMTILIALSCCTIFLIVYYIYYSCDYRKTFGGKLHEKFLTSANNCFCKPPIEITIPLTSNNNNNDNSSIGINNNSVKTNVFFLKTHKCGSSTVQNILLRHGYDNALDFVLPETKNYIGNPKKFSPLMIVDSLRTVNDKYHLFVHHTRYERSNVRSIMYKDAVYTTVLRDPATHFESLFNYYKLNRTYNVNLTDIFDDENRARKIDRNSGRKLGLNQMCWDLGVEPDDFRNRTRIKRFIEQIDRDFDLIMITEYFQASLILFANLTNWPLERLAYLKLNSRSIVDNLTDRQKTVLRRLNSCDNQLYRYFRAKFKTRLRRYGLERMRLKLAELTEINFSLRRKCVREQNDSGYAKTIRYTLKDDNDQNCVDFVKRELTFTDEIRQLQIERIKVVKDLTTFLTEK